MVFAHCWRPILIDYRLPIAGYGLTETSSAVTAFAGGKTGSCGILLPNIEIKVTLIGTCCIIRTPPPLLCPSFHHDHDHCRCHHCHPHYHTIILVVVVGISILLSINIGIHAIIDCNHLLLTELLQDSNIDAFHQPQTLPCCCNLQIIDVDTGATLGPGQDGEMCIRGPTIMKG